MNLTNRLAVFTALTIAMFAVLGASGCKPSEHDHGNRAQKFTCSMHPDVVQNTAGKCPKCGMDLTEKR